MISTKRRTGLLFLSQITEADTIDGELFRDLYLSAGQISHIGEADLEYWILAMRAATYASSLDFLSMKVEVVYAH